MNKNDSIKRDILIELEKLSQENSTLKIQHEKDISEREIAEKSFTNEKNLLKSLMNNMPDNIYFKDFKSRFIRISKSQAILFGLNDPEQAYGKTDFNFFTEEHARKAFEIEMQIMKTGLPVIDLEEKETWPDGRETWVSTTKMPLLDDNGKIIGTFGISRDITSHKKAEKELLESEEKYHHLFNNSEIGMFRTLIDGSKILEFNEKYLKILNYTREELKDKSSADMWADKSERDKMIKLLKVQGYVTDFEFDLLNKQGDVRRCVTSLKLYSDGILEGSIYDITERKIVETELEKHRYHLEELVQQRTQEWNDAYDELQIQIEREKEVELMLEQSLGKEKELSEMQSRFISTTSHEFKTPLAAILSSIELLQRYSSKWDENKKKEHYNRIIESIEYLTKLLDDILTISRTESGKINFKPESVDLFQLISECEKDNKSLFTDKHEFHLNYNADGKSFRLDRKLMKFIFNNLLSNAAKYSPTGGKIRMTINQDQKQLIIEISDEGIGIPPEEVDKIFISFYRSKNTGTIEGTGLGLAIVKRAVDLHSGEITVISELNKGTIFNVMIPLNVA